MKKKEESYRLTFKGLLTVALDFDDKNVRAVLDSLELYLRRFHMTDPGEYGAIIFDGKDFVFSSVEKEK